MKWNIIAGENSEIVVPFIFRDNFNELIIK
jgi:hypothetical protein